MNRPYTWEERRERFWAKVDRGSRDGCWPFLGGKVGGGYGLSWDGKRGVMAHRMAWRFTYGEIPDDTLILHKCDNPPCCRPDHLFQGDYSDNERDKYAKGRDNNVLVRRMKAKTHCSSGHEFTPDNTQYKRDGARRCRACRALSYQRNCQVIARREADYYRRNRDRIRARQNARAR